MIEGGYLKNMGAISRGLEIIWDKKQFLLHPPPAPSTFSGLGAIGSLLHSRFQCSDDTKNGCVAILLPRARRFLVKWSGNKVSYKLSLVALGTRMLCSRLSHRRLWAQNRKKKEKKRVRTPFAVRKRCVKASSFRSIFFMSACCALRWFG